ncbi:MAP kinase kinase (MEK) [Friedmanniomyces endolithicus]|nr:MAP kinase kinase (MEK) [Friedmanniomyces endolithicus]KAK1816599.1 MAP kinase kinase (MEK) [Friedmanniomyces endolithicus]
MGDTDNFKARTMKRKNVKGLALSAPPKPLAPPPSSEQPDSMLPASLSGPAQSSRRNDDTLEIGVEFRPKWKTEDLEVLKDLGAGNGGTVSKVRHKEWNLVMARKIIHVEAKKEVRRRIVRELQIMNECNSPYIVSFYGAFLNESGDVTMCMEYADVGSLDSISKNFGPVRVDVLGKIAEAVLGGLKYLYLVHKIMHRDIKPSNVLVNSKGQIKLCDFGVSSELVNSVADTFVGTGTYMAPERIQGANYTVKSDVWSVGLTLMELAIGKFPFSIESDDGDDEDAAGPQGILDLLQQIVLEPSPRLPKSDAFPRILEDVIDKCLMKNPAQRPTPQELYDTDPFLQAAKRTPVDLEQWAVSMMEKHNRKSHLAPMLSPATQALLRGEDGTPGTASTVRSMGSSRHTASRQPTPTSGEIPIGSAPSFNGGMGRDARSRDDRSREDVHSARSRAEPIGRAEAAVQAGVLSGASNARPSYPTRTSSTVQTATVPAGGYGHQPLQMQLPVRQAPPSSRSNGGGGARPEAAERDYKSRGAARAEVGEYREEGYRTNGAATRPEAGENSEGSYRSERSERRPKPGYVQ